MDGESRTCPKCGGVMSGPQFCRGGMACIHPPHGMQVPHEGEALHRTCTRCGYTTTEPTNDASKGAQSDVGRLFVSRFSQRYTGIGSR